MFGMGSSENKNKFDFDLEREIKKEPVKGKKMIEKVGTRIQEIKNHLREGKSASQEMDELGVILHGYTALKKVLSRVVGSQS
jgi:hypothetical protein